MTVKPEPGKQMEELLRRVVATVFGFMCYFLLLLVATMTFLCFANQLHMVTNIVGYKTEGIATIFEEDKMAEWYQYR